jgi:hypothetical protein
LPIAQQPNNYIHSQSDFEAQVVHEHAQENELDPDEDSVAALPSTDEGNATNDDARPALQVTEEFGNFVLSLQGRLMYEEKINILLRLTQHGSYDKELTRSAFPNLRTLKKRRLDQDGSLLKMSGFRRTVLELPSAELWDTTVKVSHHAAAGPHRTYP